MIELEIKKLSFRTKQIWFSDHLYDDNDGCSAIDFRRCKLQINHLGFNCNEEVTSVIDLTKDLDTIWSNMKKDSCRNSIKRAEKAGIVINQDQGVDEFYNIYKKHFKAKGYLRFAEPVSILSKCGKLFTAVYNGEILGGHVYLEDKDHIVYYRGATIITNDKQLNTLKGNASRLLHWEAIKYAKEKGIKEFDLGGLGLYHDSINAMKESFGGKRVTYYSYYKTYDRLYKILIKLNAIAATATSGGR
jgi:lipid II:glycine glycyltransferase (peptidoglycan interpeptide bridge formation enzyme)